MSYIMNIKEVSSYLNLKEQTVYRLLKSGKLPGVKIGGTWMIKKGHIDNMFNEVLAEKMNALNAK